jgi:Icc-related predicted phosphoesterase
VLHGRGKGVRIYAVSDIHGRTERISTIGANVRAYTPDVLVVAGDIATYRGHRAVLCRLNDLGLPVLAVRGNADGPRVDRLLEAFSRTQSLHLRETVLCGVAFTGVSGAIPVPFRTRLRMKEKPLVERLVQLVRPHSVLVTHPPPRGTLDQVLGRFHAGCSRLRDVILAQQPRMLICGHIHEKPGTARLGKTLVVNCNLARGNGGAMIDLDEGRDPRIVML